jgi:hypothetical protein
LGRAEYITKHLRAYDRELYCAEDTEGKLCVWRKISRVESYSIDGVSIGFVRPDSHRVFSLTHNWGVKGRPADWGILPIIEKLKSCDIWQRDIVSDLEVQQEKIDKENTRAMDNQNEAFLKDFRSQFAKATNDVRVANMDMKKDLRRTNEKKIKEY